MFRIEVELWIHRVQPQENVSHWSWTLWILFHFLAMETLKEKHNATIVDIHIPEKGVRYCFGIEYFRCNFVVMLNRVSYFSFPSISTFDICVRLFVKYPIFGQLTLFKEFVNMMALLNLQYFSSSGINASLGKDISKRNVQHQWNLLLQPCWRTGKVFSGNFKSVTYK